MKTPLGILSLIGMLSQVRSLASNIGTTASTSNAKRIALVTGANKGIGKEIVRLLGREENIVTILTCRSPDASTVLKNLVQELEGKDACTDLHFIPSPVDLTKPDQFDSTVRSYIDDNFDGRLDILINNAAICFNDLTLYGKVKYIPFE